MKTAEEHDKEWKAVVEQWLHGQERKERELDKDYYAWIESIQLDAIKHGMTLAAEIVDKTGRVDAILITRDNLKELPK
jgi:hypothetical protein